MAEPLLDVRNLSVVFPTPSGDACAVSDVSFQLPDGGSLALLGESGSGKTATARALMGILDRPVVVGGEAVYGGRNLLTESESAMGKLRGSEIAMVFQDALSALNPSFTVGWQIAEVFRVHEKTSRKVARARALDAMKRVGIPDAERRFGDYPHQFSGGMRQRVLIASALALNPRLLIADEPTTALDVTVQAQIMDLIRSIHDEHGMALLLISHDLEIVRDVVDDVVIMYGGEVMERGPVGKVYGDAHHPYTQALLASMPSVQPRKSQLRVIAGSPPVGGIAHAGCPFHARCPAVFVPCPTVKPPTVTVDGRELRCHLFSEGAAS